MTTSIEITTLRLMADDEPPARVASATLKPYASLIVLRCQDDIDPGAAFSQLTAKLRQIRKLGYTRTSLTVVGEGLEDSSLASLSPIQGFDETMAIVHRIEGRPGWLSEPTYSDVRHELTIALRWEFLIAVHLPGSIQDRFQKWLDKAPRPMLRRVPPAILEQALLKGESRGLWLRGTHPRRKTLADSKNIVGSDLRQTLSVTEDQTYAYNSARSVLPSTPDRISLKGTVGTTPSRSLVWNKPTENFDDFCTCAIELLRLIKATFTGGLDGVPAFPLLPQPTNDFSDVWGAYDISCVSPLELPDSINDDKVVAADILESAALQIEGKQNSPDFKMHVGTDGRTGGVVRGRIWHDDGQAELRIGLLPGADAPEVAQPVCDALQFTDLLTIYYASGHAFTNGVLYKSQPRPRPFPNWEWQDFTGFDISREKPGEPNWSSEQIHRAIGNDSDTSLFGWVVKQYSTGWLTCDDGSGEVADFIHVSADELTVSLIHVKGADNNSLGRGVSATVYEVVTSQAVKNTIFLDNDVLIEALRKAPTASPATWTDGQPERDREYLLEAITARDARSKSKVVIVQPHMSKTNYDRYYAEAKSDRPSANLLRLRRLETILNGGRPAVTSMGSDLTVYGSLQ